VTGLADTVAFGESERLGVFGQTFDKDVVGKVHGKGWEFGLWRCGAYSEFVGWEEISL